MNNSIETIKQQLAQLAELHASGVLPQAQYDEGRATLERRLLDLVLSGAVVGSGGAAPAPSAAPAAAVAATSSAAAVASRRPSGKLLAGLGALVLLLAAAGYTWKGNPELLHPGATAKVAETAARQAGGGDGAPDAGGGGAAPHATNADQIAAMTDKLVARLKEQPDDVEGWAMLARTYDVLQRHGDAVKAYEKAISLRKDDPALLADYADSLAVNNGGSLEGEPMKQLDKALKLDPKNLKALALVGTYAFNTKDYANAAKVWEKLVQVGPPDNVFVKQIVPGLVEARKLAGLPPMPEPLNADLKPLQSPAATGAVTSGAKVSGTVKLAPALAKQAGPDDTVFIFARPAEGSRMPLAIMRRQVKDLPLQFTLDDSMAMSPSTALSSAKKVIIGARISKSGNAMPQAGDLQGLSGVVSVGSSDVRIEIKEPVKQ